MTFVVEKSQNFKSDVIVHMPSNNKVKIRRKLSCEFKLIEANEADELIYDDGYSGLLKEVLISVSGFDIGESFKKDGEIPTHVQVAIGNLPMRSQIAKKYLEEIQGADGKNSRRRR